MLILGFAFIVVFKLGFLQHLKPTQCFLLKKSVPHGDTQSNNTFKDGYV